MNGKPSLNYHDPWDTLHFEFVEDEVLPTKRMRLPKRLYKFYLVLCKNLTK